MSSKNKQMSSLNPLPLEGGVSVQVAGRRHRRSRRYGVGGEEPAVEVAVAPAVAGQMDMEGARRRRRSRRAGQEGARRRRSHKAGQEGARRHRSRKAGQSMKAGQEGARRRRHSRRH